MVCTLVKVLTWPMSLCSKDRRWKRRKGTRLIIDWHNYGWTILEVNGASKMLIKLARRYELFFGRFGDYHLTVSEAMKINLATL